MPSKTKLAKKFQIGLIVICVSLVLIYLVEPMRFQIVYPVSLWASHLAHVLGVSTGNNEILLSPSNTIGISARPQLNLAENYLLGCDRALQGGQLYLVTDWRLATTDRIVLQIQFLLPNHITQEITQTLDRPQLFTPLPAGFYAGDRQGTVWLKQKGADDEQWMQVCKR
jgi:hypothetical protein